MARYKIASLNYITSGSKRTMVNMDVQMLYQNVKHIYILSHEKDKLSNIVTEQFDFKYLPTEYIEKEHPINNRQGEYSHTQRPLSDNYDLFPHSLSSEPLSEEEVPSSIILNENQKYGYETSLSDHMRILLQTRENTAKIQNQIDSFKRYQKNKTFVIEDRASVTNGFSDVNTVQISGQGWQSYIYPMYDIKDVSIKTKLQKQQLNPNIKVSQDYAGRHMDIYCPEMREDPIGFCQMKNDSYMITNRTDKLPYTIRTSIISARNETEVDDFYDVSITDGKIPTYLYKTARDYDADSLYQVLSDRQDYSLQMDMFTPNKSMDGIKYNYMVVVDQQDIPSKYEVGDIYAQQIDTGKNAYDALYSMDVNHSDMNGTTTDNCREYKGVFTDGQHVFLKYYDNASYYQISAQNKNDMQRIAMHQREQKKYPFQKIETYLPNNFETRCKHKSNLFSIKISNKNIEDLVNLDENVDSAEKEQGKVLYDQIHKEIKNAIGKIAENICPVNTQFFDVYFDK